MLLWVVRGFAVERGVAAEESVVEKRWHHGGGRIENARRGSICEGFFQANMPPMVEAKMIARMTQQIMIMIFFCSSRQGKKKHMRIGSTVQSSKDRTHERGSGRGRGYEGGWRWIWLLEPGLFIHMSLLRGRFKAGPTALPEDACHVLRPAGYRDDRLTPFPPRASILNERTKFLWGQHLRSETHSNTVTLCSLRVKPFSKIRTSDPSDRAHV